MPSLEIIGSPSDEIKVSLSDIRAIVDVHRWYEALVERVVFTNNPIEAYREYIPEDLLQRDLSNTPGWGFIARDEKRTAVVSLQEELDATRWLLSHEYMEASLATPGLNSSCPPFTEYVAERVTAEVATQKDWPVQYFSGRSVSVIPVSELEILILSLFRTAARAHAGIQVDVTELQRFIDSKPANQSWEALITKLNELYCTAGGTAAEKDVELCEAWGVLYGELLLAGT